MGLTANALESNLTEAKRYLSREQGILVERYPGLAKLTPIYQKYVSEIQPDQPSAPQKSTNQAGFPTPTAEDIAYAKNNPNSENLFIKRFGRKP